MPIPEHLVIYARGTDDQVAEQQTECITNLEEPARVTLIKDAPGESSGWESAQAMRAAGLVDRIVTASRDVVPPMDGVESVSGEIRSPYKHAGRLAEPPWHRRPRRLRGFRR